MSAVFAPEEILNETELVLSDDQENALTSITGFLMENKDKIFVLKGYSGTGKSTLIRTFINRYDGLMKTIQLVNPKYKPRDLVITATTHKACDVIRQMTGAEVNTIYSVLELTLKEDITTGKKNLKPTSSEPISGCLLLIDEASMLELEMDGYLHTLTPNCQIIAIGDPKQLIKEDSSEVFTSDFPQAELKKIMRQQSGTGKPHPIEVMGAKFREAVDTGVIPQCELVEDHITWLNDGDYLKALHKEFIDNPHWCSSDSRIVAFTNNCVKEYNHHIFSNIHQRTHFQKGDEVVNNRYFKFATGSLKTDQTVQVLSSHKDSSHGVLGMRYRVGTGSITATMFVPDNLTEYERSINYYRENHKYNLVREIQSTWGDLRAIYASTVHKAQGSTFNKVFIDLTDISRCRDMSMLARLLYVATTRAKHQVIFRGDLI